MFKMRIGDAIADTLIDSVSSAIQESSEEAEAAAAIRKSESNRHDTLKSIVFMLTHNIGIDRTIKKQIAKLFSEVEQEQISLFSIEDKIDTAYKLLSENSPENFFIDIDSIFCNRVTAMQIYMYICFVYMRLNSEDAILPAHIHNFYLIKKNFRFSRAELAECYGVLAKMAESDTDDMANLFEELTSEENIAKIESENPALVYIEPEEDDVADEEATVANISENPLEDIKALYSQCLTAAADDSNEVKKHLFLADSNPDFVMKAVKLYAKDCVGEEAIFVYDDTFMKSCKDGFLLTNKNLFIGSSGKLSAKIPLSEINFIDVSVSTFIYKIKVNSAEISSAQILKNGTIALANLLKEAIPLAMQIK